MLPPQNEEEATDISDLSAMNPPTHKGQITASMSLLLPAIQETQAEEVIRPSFKTITTLPRFQTEDTGVEYHAEQRYKVRKKKKRRKRRESEEDDDDDGYDLSDDAEPYDIWHRPPIQNEEANEDGKQLIRSEYENIVNESFLELMLKNETECDKLAQLMCNKKLSSKDLRKENRDCHKYELFDVLRFGEEKDDGGLNPDDYDIDIREMEELFNTFNNDTLHSFMEGYFNGTLPFEPREPYPMGLIETDVTKQRRVKTVQNPNYISQHRRKNRQRLKEKHIKKREKARKKRRKEKKLKLKLARKKREKIKEKLSKQLAPDVLEILFNPTVIDPNAKEEEVEPEIYESELKLEVEKDANLRIDDEALEIVNNSDTKERIKSMRLERQHSRRKGRMDSDRHSMALQSPMTGKTLLADIITTSHTSEFDDDKQMKMGNIPLTQVFDEQQLRLMEAPIAHSRDYDGVIKRYARPIKKFQIEKVYKYVLFKAVRQYFARIYLQNQDITDIITTQMNAKSADYDQIKYQMRSEDSEKQDICTDIMVQNQQISEIKCDLDISYYIAMKKRRDTDVLVQKHYVSKQRAMLQLISMGLELEDIESDIKDNELSAHGIKQAFMEGIDGSQIAAEDKAGHNHDEDDDNVRMCACVYDSDDEKVNEKVSKRAKYSEKSLRDHCENERKSNTLNPKPWQKLHPKHVHEFVHKFCGFYPFESRPLAWKRIWHQNMKYSESSKLWPSDWMQQFDKGTLDMSAFGEDEMIDTSKIKSVKCIDQIAGECNESIKFGPLFETAEMKEYYTRVLNNIPRLPLDLEDLKLPSFVWRVNECDLSKYGTHLFTNWKQSSDGKVTANQMRNNEKFPIVLIDDDLYKRQWLSSKEWYVYRLRYWEGEDIEDFLDDSEKEGMEWFGSNDRVGYHLIEDRLCLQNDHCYGEPSLFLWTHDFCNEQQSKLCEPIKIRNYGVSADVVSNDKHIQTEKSMFNLDSPIVKTGSMPSDGPIRSGTKLSIGARDVDLDYEDLNDGIIAMDAYIPPVFNLSVYDDMDCLYYNWNRVNHDNIADRASSKQMAFVNKNAVFDRMISDENNILKCWDESESDWVDYNNYPLFDRIYHSHPSILSNAFFFHNFVHRTFHSGPKNIAKICYPRNWQKAVFSEKGSDEWTLAFGFTHPRPIAPEKYCVLLYKKDAIEVRITSDTHKKEEKDAHESVVDLIPQNVEESDKCEFEVIDSGNKYEWTEERLEIMLNIHCDGKMKSVQLFSELIRDKFDKKDCFHEINERTKNKKFIFAECNFMSHVVIVSKSAKDGVIKCYLDGKIVCHKSISDLVGNNKDPKLCTTKVLNANAKENSILVAHKPGNKKGKVHGLFHGYIYGISLHSLCFEPFELNTLYRQLCVHRDLHVVSTWFRNKNELSQAVYKQFL